MKKMFAIPAVMGAIALTFSGCAAAPTESAKPSSNESAQSSASSSAGSSAGTGTKVKACMVSDSGGFNDKSFNETSHNGMKKAVDEFGLETAEVESTNAADFEKNIQSMIDAKCGIIVTVGFALGDATVSAAKAHPDVKFAIVDWGDPKGAGIANLKQLTYNTAQSSFLAGYAAAATTKSGTVGTFGGAKYPTVTIFMDGFAQGVEAYNTAKGKQVKVVGWDPKTQDGQFVGGFEDVAGGKRTAQTLTAQGADVVFPVAGPASEGAAQVALESNGTISAIWPDSDGCASAAKYCKVFLTSVLKGMDVSVYEAIKAANEGTFDAKPYIGDLSNGGTAIAEFHDFESKVPAELKGELDALKQDIISGKITITSAAQPK